MASYIELRSLFPDDALRNRIDVAVIVAASDLIAGNPTASEQMWIAAAFNNPRVEGQKAFMAVLATNRGFSVAQIQGASDATLQTAVNAVIPTLIVAL